MAKASPKLEINQATAEELAALPGIGPSTAETLIKLRDQRGGFKSVDDLEEVQGLGAQTLKNIRGHVSVSAKAQAGGSGNGAEGAGRAAEKTAEKTAEKSASAAREGGKAVAETAAETGRAAAERSAESGRSAVETAAQSARAGTEAFRRTATQQTDTARRSLEVAAGQSEELGHAATEAQQQVLGSMREVNEVWLGLVQSQFQANVETAQRMMQCRTPQDLAELQSTYMRTSMERLVDGTSRAVAASSQLAQTMWRPFQGLARR